MKTALIATILYFISATYLLAELPKRIILHGDIITMNENGIVPDGKIIINTKSGRTEQILHKNEEYKPQSGDQELKIDGYIYPGLIDLHNHLKYNCSRILDLKKKFKSRYEWQKDSTYLNWSKKYGEGLISKAPYKINAYAEVKALIGGVSVIQGANTKLQNDYDFLLLNLESTKYRKSIYSSVFVYDKNSQNHDFLDYVVEKINKNDKDAYIFHLGEGYDQTNKEEFTRFSKKGLLSQKSVLIHGVSFEESHFKTMSQKGAHLVWSPASNLILYNKTTDIKSAKKNKLNICLGTDWSPSGTKNLLHELKIAALYNQKHLNKLFTYKELIEMATVNPAKAISLEEEMGSISPNTLANIAIFSKKDPNPYKSLIMATEKDLILSIIKGTPMYGSKTKMEDFYSAGELHNFEGYKKSMLFRYKDENGKKFIFNEIVNDLNKLINKDETFLKNSVELDPIFPDKRYLEEILKTTSLPLHEYWE